MIPDGSSGRSFFSHYLICVVDLSTWMEWQLIIYDSVLADIDRYMLFDILLYFVPFGGSHSDRGAAAHNDSHDRSFQG